MRPEPVEVLQVGLLVLLGVTRELTLKAEITGTEQDPWGNDRVGLEVTGQLERGDYGTVKGQVTGDLEGVLARWGDSTSSRT